MEGTVSDEIDRYLQDCVRIEPLALQEEYVRLPADYAYWNEQYRQALEASLVAKADKERIWSTCYLVETERTHPTTGKPVTVDYAKAAVEANQEYYEAVKAAITTEVELTRIKGVLEAIRAKREMLVSLGATLRQEMQHDPMVRDNVATQRLAR